jgi:tripartite-type tricarboxylate transporter receptor subunit TctC
MPELIARANPGELNWTSPGSGTTPHPAGEVLKLRTSIQMQHILFAGAGQSAARGLLARACPLCRGYSR